MTHEQKVRGDCFVVAGRYLIIHQDTKNIRLCHGKVTGIIEGEENEHWHAWIETDSRIIDDSNGKHYRGHRDKYYASGKINPKTVRKYTYKDAHHYMFDTRTFGPWED